MPVLKHIHTYQRIKSEPNKPIMFRCTHPDCTHIQRKELLLGKRAACACSNTFIMSVSDLRLKDPHCPLCTKGIKQRKSVVLPDEIVIETIMPELLKPLPRNLELQLITNDDQDDKFEGEFGGEL